MSVDFDKSAASAEEARSSSRRCDGKPRSALSALSTRRLHVLRALKAGARAYLLKGLLRKELLDTIRLVHAAKSACCRRWPRNREHRQMCLSPREIEVLRLISGGNANKGSPPNSPSRKNREGPRKNILANARTIETHAVTIGLKRGIIESEPSKRVHAIGFWGFDFPLKEVV